MKRRPPATLGVDDLVDAMCNMWLHRTVVGGLRDYWTARYRLLVEGLGLPGDPLDGRGLPARTGGVVDLLRRTLPVAVRSPNPFADYLAGGGVPGELCLEHGLGFVEHARRHDELHRALVRACLLRLAPGIEGRTCSIEVLTRAGLSAAPPDPMDYF